MTLFAYVAVFLLAWEGLALLLGDRWPPTITETVRSFDGLWQAVAAVAIMLIPALHLFEVIA